VDNHYPFIRTRTPRRRPRRLVEVDPILTLPQPEDPLSTPWIQQLLPWPSVRRGAIWHVVHRRS
ncbi:hypothetical protein NQ315_009085, partial [Exocentrus adspersus]